MKRRFRYGLPSLRFADGLPRARRLLRALAFAFVISGSLLLTAGVALYAIAQTSAFNRWLAGVLQQIVRDQLHADLSIASVRVDVFRGVQLDSVALIADGDTVLTVPHIELRYMPEALIFRTVAVSKLEFDSPRIHLARRTDGTWNIEHVLKPTNTPPSEPPSLLLYLRALKLHGGSITINDSLSNIDTTGRFDPIHAHLQHVELRATVVAQLRQQYLSVAIEHLSWLDGNSGWRLDRMLGIVEADTTQIHIRSMTIKLPASQISIENSVLRYADSTLPFRGHLRMDPFHPSDGRYILPPDVEIGAPVALDAEVSGTAQHIRLAITQARTGSTVLRGTAEIKLRESGAVSHWHVAFEHSPMRWSDMRRLLVRQQLPSLAQLDACYIEHLEARGYEDSVHAHIRAVCGPTRGDVAAKVVLGGPVPRYHVAGTIEGLDLTAVDTTLPRTSLRAAFDVDGSGTALDQLHFIARVELDSSRLEHIRIEHAVIAARVENSTLILDTLSGRLTADAAEDVPRLFARGTIGLAAPNTVSMEVDAEHLPIDRMFGIERLPQLLSARVHLESSGATLDSLRFRLNAEVPELVFQDRAVFPFTLSAVLDLDAAGNRSAVIRSPQIEARIVGRYTLMGLRRVVEMHILMADTLLRRLIARAENGTQTPLPPVQWMNDTLAARVTLRAKSLALLAPLLAPTVVEADATIIGDIVSEGDRSRAVFDTVQLGRLILSRPDGSYVASMPASGSLAVALSALDREPRLDSARIRLAVDSVLRIGTARIVRPALRWEWDGVRLRIVTDTAWLENTMPLAVGATITPEPDGTVSITAERFLVGLSNNFSWSAPIPLQLQLDTSGYYTLGAVRLKHEQSEATLDLSGRLGAKGIESVFIVVRAFNLTKLASVPVLGAFDVVQHLSGMTDSLVVSLDGSWKRPRVSVVSSMRNVTYGDVPIGDHEATFSYDGEKLWGTATVLVPIGSGGRRTAFDVRIESLPLTVSLAPSDIRVREREPIAITATAHDMSLAIVEPFFPAVSQLRGTADLRLSIAGTLPGNIAFTGRVEYDNCEFLIPATNIRYRSRGVLVLDNNLLRIETIELFNDPADLVGGMAQIVGTVSLRDFQPDALDIAIKIPGNRGFLVMSNATAAVNNMMYGRVVISTEEDGRMRQLHMNGTVEQPRLGGFLRIEEADVTFPPATAITVQTSSFTYRKVGEGYLVTDAVELVPRQDTTIGDLPPRHSTPPLPVRLSITPGFSERLYTAVDVKIRRQMRVKMDFSSVEQLVAFVEQENRSEYLRFVRDGTRRTELRGTLVVDPSSTYKFYSTFTASGRLRFTTGAIDNPEVDLRAVYDGERIVGSDNRRERYRVILTITGTKQQPRVRMTYEINGEEAPGTRGDSVRIMTNALLLVLFGRTQEELTGGTSGSVATSALDQSVNAARSAAISAFLTNALQGGVIKNVNIDFGTSDVTSLSQARIMLTGQLFGANVTVGGSVADLAQNSQVTLDLSIGNTLGIEWLRNLIAQFQATANPGQSLSRQQKQWEFRLGWRLP
ncbi:MAG: translocation/assembly module TamB domain-containing protein [Chlorobi bacterium]|nr:translocation/assembly module TamB domain-containing protein [Chlorobiota bacterium]